MVYLKKKTLFLLNLDMVQTNFLVVSPLKPLLWKLPATRGPRS